MGCAVATWATSLSSAHQKRIQINREACNIGAQHWSVQYTFRERGRTQIKAGAPLLL